MSDRPFLPEWADRKPIIGMLHLLPLPGSPRYDGDLNGVRDALLHDVEALCEGGVDGLLLENFGDTPYFPGAVPASTVAHMTRLAVTVRVASDLPIGINILRNDGVAALAVAQAADGRFVRVNVLAGARLTDQGLVQGIAHELLRERARLGAEEIRILADIDVKHSAPVASTRLEDDARDLVERAGADVLVVSGSGTGRAASSSELGVVRRTVPGTAVFVGSGLRPEADAELVTTADGFIVGTACKRDGVVTAPVDVGRVRSLVRRLRTAGP